MRVLITHALSLLRRDLARLNDLLDVGDHGSELIGLAEVTRAANDPDDPSLDLDDLPLPLAGELPPEELAAGLQAVWAKADATLVRPGAPQASGALAVSVLHARRYTQQDLLRATPGLRFQMLHGLRTTLAAAGTDQLEESVGLLFSLVDPGPDRVVWGHKLGLVHVRLRVTGDPAEAPKEFEGWFFDGHVHDESCFWPSPRARLSQGRLFVADSVIFTGVEIRNGEPRVDARKGLPVAKTLAAALGELAAGLDVELVHRPEAGEVGYFGSDVHTYQVSEGRG